MKNIHKLLFIFIIFTVLLVPSYSVKADPTTSTADNTSTENKIIPTANGSQKSPIDEISRIYEDGADIFELRKVLINSNVTADEIRKFIKDHGGPGDIFLAYLQNYLERLESNQGDITDCEGIFGNVNDESSTAYMIQKFLNYIKVLAPLLVVLLSGFDFAKNALSGDQDEMKKATKKLGIRLACAVGVYLAPLIAWFIINFINNSSVDQSCNIK